MKFDRTKWYFNELVKYRASVKELQETLSYELDGLQEYAGSSGYDKKVAELQEDHEVKVKELQNHTKKEIAMILNGMRTSVNQRPVKAPSDEQKVLLETLRMMEKPTIQDIERVGKAVTDCPLAASVVNEIAARNGHEGYKVHTSEIGTKEAQQIIDGLEEFALITCGMNEVGNRGKWLRSSAYHVDGGRDIKKFRCDRDFDDPASMIGFAGAVSTGEYDNFSEAVSN